MLPFFYNYSTMICMIITYFKEFFTKHPIFKLVVFIFFTTNFSQDPVFQPGEMDFLKDKTRGLFQDSFEDLALEETATLLKDPFYLFTYPLKKRDMISLYKKQLDQAGDGVTCLYYQMSKNYFTQSEGAIKSYVKLKQEALLEMIDERNFTDIAIPPVLSLFEPIKVQQRSFNLFFKKQFEYGNWTIMCLLPFSYQEQNFYLNFKERAAIQNYELFKPRIAQATTIEHGPAEKPKGQDTKTFLRNHLLSDQIGFSDMHVEFSKIYKQWDYSYCVVGCDVTLPTAFAFKKGLIGNHFNKKYPTPDFDLHTDFLDLYAERQYDQLKQNGIDFGVAVLDRLSTILLEQPLGNGRHCACAPFFQLTVVMSSIELINRVAIEFQLPMYERRFFKQVPDKAALDAVATVDVFEITEQEAQDQINFLSKQLLKKLFPESYKTGVVPGLIFQADLMMRTLGKVWSLECGLQWWYQAKEYFTSVAAPSNDKKYLDLQAGRQGSAYQATCFFGITKQQAENDSFGLRGSFCPISKQIGKAFSLSFSYGWGF